jgi:hypothetical protein
MVGLAKSFNCIALLITVSVATMPAALTAQEPALRHWTLTGSLTALGGGDLDGWAVGPELGLRYDFGPQWGIVLRASLPVFDAADYSDEGAAALDLGATWTHRGARSEVGFALGASAFLVGEAGELTDGGIGPFAAGQVTRWLSPTLGLTGGATVRIGSADGGIFPSLSAGLSLRL